VSDGDDEDSKVDHIRPAGQMTLPNAIRVLAESWADVTARLTGEQRAVLAGLLGEVLASHGVARRDAALDIMELVIPLLPPEHRVRRAFAEEGKKFDGGPADWDPALTAVTALRPQMAEIAGAIKLVARPDAAPRPDGIRQAAERWLLAAPALDPAEVRRRGGDPDDPGLIRLGPAGDARLPSFQFGADGRPYPVVTAINRLLAAEDDPWGVADWWLGPNAWIGAVPADVIGDIDDQLLIEAARAVVEEA
jgi:hypothetical protein